MPRPKQPAPAIVSSASENRYCFAEADCPGLCCEQSNCSCVLILCCTASPRHSSTVSTPPTSSSSPAEVLQLWFLQQLLIYWPEMVEEATQVIWFPALRLQKRTRTTPNYESLPPLLQRWFLPLPLSQLLITLIHPPAPLLLSSRPRRVSRLLCPRRQRAPTSGPCPRRLRSRLRWLLLIW